MSDILSWPPLSSSELSVGSCFLYCSFRVLSPLSVLVGMPSSMAIVGFACLFRFVSFADVWALLLIFVLVAVSALASVSGSVVVPVVSVSFVLLVGRFF